MGDSLPMFFCSMSVSIAEERGCSERRLAPDGLSVSQPASSSAAAIAAEASNGRTNGRRFNPKLPRPKAFPGPYSSIVILMRSKPQDERPLRPPFEHAISERKVNRSLLYP